MSRVAYLFSRYPFLSQTFCDSEMLALEAAGRELVVGSLYPPEASLRHARLNRLRAPVLHAPPPAVLRELEALARRDGRWPAALVDRHERTYGPAFQAAVRARNALYFADRFTEMGVAHVHVHFANRATHTALFLRELTGLPMSFTTHGQDFMVDLGSDALLAEMCGAATAVVSVCDWSQRVLAAKCPAAAAKMVRIYNGIDPAEFAPAPAGVASGTLRLVSVGRLIEFKGFHVLIDAVAAARAAGHRVELRIIGDGPWRERLAGQIACLGLDGAVALLGAHGVEAVRAELAGADAFALACVVDSAGASDLLPTVIAEAMFSGLPVLSTTVAGVPEMVAEGETGLLAAPGDAAGLAAAMARLATAPDFRQHLGAAGRRRAEAVFSSAVTTPQLAAIFDRAPAPPGPPATQPNGLAFFDLGEPGRAANLARVWDELAARGIRILAAGGQAEAAVLAGLGPRLREIEWLPDGAALEMEWRARESWRRELENLRTAASWQADGEAYLAAARRAVWLAARLAAGPVPRLLAAGEAESAVVWLAARLGAPPPALALALARDPRPGPLARLLDHAAETSPTVPAWPQHAADLDRWLGTPGKESPHG
jgi:glycosyltransferase involved in cell wall biosynthesis